jgi:hypothetical protein
MHKIALFLGFSLLATGCAVNVTDEDIASNEQSVVNGYGWSWQGYRPYEKMFVQVFSNVGSCSGTLIGGPDYAQYVLTAKHCFNSDSTPDDVEIRRMEGQTNYSTRRGVSIHKAPNRSNGDNVDVALVKLDSRISVPGSVYFSNMDGVEIVGQKLRCYGFGPNYWDGDGYVGGGKLRWADFTAIRNTYDNPNNSSTWYELQYPNSANQALAPGDSGGSCFHSPDQVEDELKYFFTLTGVHKGGSGDLGDAPAGSTPTKGRQTSSAWFSSWVRGYVPRPSETH